MSLKRVTIGIAYGGQNATTVRTTHFVLKGTLDYNSDAIRNKVIESFAILKTVLVADARIVGYRINLMKSTVNDPQPKRKFVSKDALVQGTRPQSSGVDAAIEPIIARFTLSPRDGYKGSMEIPYSILETEWESDQLLRPEQTNNSLAPWTDFATAFLSHWSDSTEKMVMPGENPDYEGNSRLITEIRFDGIKNYRATHDYTNIRSGENHLITRQINDINSEYRRALVAAENANQVIDATVVADVRARYGALKTQWGATRVVARGIPYPLSALLGTAQQD